MAVVIKFLTLSLYRSTERTKEDHRWHDSGIGGHIQPDERWITLYNEPDIDETQSLAWNLEH